MNSKTLYAALIGAWLAVLLIGAQQSQSMNPDGDQPVARTALGML